MFVVCGGVNGVFVIFVKVSVTGRALPATGSRWILQRGVNHSSSCRLFSLSFWEVRGVGGVTIPVASATCDGYASIFSGPPVAEALRELI